MSTNYPSAKDSFTDPAGTQYQDVVDHAAQHTNANDAIVAIETTVGTTAGTNVLKNFAAGDLAVRHNTSGVLTSTLNLGTIGTLITSHGSLNAEVGTIGTLVGNTGTVGTINPGTFTTVNAIPGSALSTNASFLGISTFTGTQTITTGAGETSVTNGSVTVTVPSGGRRVKVTVYVADMNINTANASGIIRIKEGSGTLNSGFNRLETSGQGHSQTIFWVGTASAASHTYFVTILAASGTATITNTATDYGFILAELL